MRRLTFLGVLVVTLAGCASGAASTMVPTVRPTPLPATPSGNAWGLDLPAGWAAFSDHGVHWAMPANPIVRTAGQTTTYGHNAVKSDGSIDPDATYTVSIQAMGEPPTDEQLLAAVSTPRSGWRLATAATLTPPLRGAETTFKEDSSGITGVIRSMAFGEIVVIALQGGDVGSDRAFFLATFGAD